MAFPTSPSNNQVHAEGNRKWVWDSTSSTWDQVGESAGVQSTWRHQPGSVVQVTRGINNSASSGSLSDHGSSSDPVTDITKIVSADITPHYYDSKILVNWNVRLNFGNQDFHTINLCCEIDDTVGTRNIVVRSTQSGTGRYRSTIAGQLKENHNLSDHSLFGVSDQWLDDPRESVNFAGDQKLSYMVVLGRYVSGGTYYLNRTAAHRDHAEGYDGCCTSTMTLMEIKQ